jgi:hypothetical protein
MIHEVHTLMICAQTALKRCGPGWIPESDVTMNVGGEAPVALSHVGFKRIAVNVNLPNLATRVGEHTRGTRPADVLGIGRKVVRASVMLWAGHYDSCPWDSWRHKRLCVAAAVGAFGTSGITPQQWALATEVAAFFERNLVAFLLTQREGDEFAEGLVWERVVNRYPQSLLVSLFFRAQSLLAPGSWGVALQKGRIAFEPLVEALAPDVTELLFDVRVRRAGGRVRVRGSVRRVPPCAEWLERVRRLARLLVPYLSEQPTRQPPSPFGQPHLNSPTGRELMNSAGLCGDAAGGLRETLPGTHGHPGPQRSRGTGGFLPSQDAGQYHRADFDELDRHYSQWAQALVVEAEAAETTPRNPQQLTVGFLDSEPCSLGSLVTAQIDWFRTRCRSTTPDAALRFQLFRRSDPLDIPLGGDEPGDLGVPHLLLVVDSSGSMRFDPSAPASGARGQYDVVLMACYGIFKHIEASGLGDEVQVACINFSGRSIFSGWHPFSGINEVKRVLLAYQGGGTALSPDAIRHAFEKRPGRFLAIAITDGGLSNVQPAAAELKKIVDDHCALTLLHIGQPNDFTRAVGAMQCPVHVLQNAESLTDLTLRIAQDTYALPGS